MTARWCRLSTTRCTSAMEWSSVKSSKKKREPCGCAGNASAMELKGTGSADSHVIRYRADIDGLRAVAVLSVVAFHLWRTASPGGYLGVDIFFVLSGYLITSILWREVQEGSFSIVRFY